MKETIENFVSINNLKGSCLAVAFFGKYANQINNEFICFPKIIYDILTHLKACECSFCKMILSFYSLSLRKKLESIEDVTVKNELW